ncbi:MAG: molybdopterin-dependent oxidoreductase [Chloroflexi bacterium]|nr:molybdopterin-dependent oxidoreductase [Chloroflexota bacterium]
MPAHKSDMSSSKKGKGDRFSINRRTFLKASAFTGAAVAASRIIKYPEASLVSSQPSTEGVITERWITTSCLNCSTRCATQVRVVNGKAVKIVGNPLSQVSEGEICPRGHIGLQVLYDPNRLSVPLKRTNPAKGRGVAPDWVPISWSQALGEVSARLKALRDEAQPHQLLLLHGLNTSSDEDMIYRFAAAYGTPNVVSGDTLENEAAKSGRWLADGNSSHIAYDFGQTNYILVFGADILEYEKPLARNLRMWGKIRRERPNRAKVVVIDRRYSVTAAKSDRWLPVNPGSDAALAMALANVIISEGLYDTDFISGWTTGFDEYKELALSYYSPQRVAAITGIETDTIRQIAREFARSRPAIAWAGRGVAAWPNGTYNSYAIFCLNALVGSIDTPGGVIYQENPGYRDLPEPAEDDIARAGKDKPRLDFGKTSLFPAAAAVANQVADSILNDDPYPLAVAIGFNSNFNMSAPGAWRWDAALKKLPYYVHLAPFISEMAEYADIILPSSTFLEEWGYDHSPPGSGFAEAKIKQPVVAPLDDSKGVADTIFEIASRLGGTVASSFAAIGGDAQGFVRYRTETLMPWSDFREKGVWLGPAYQYHKYDRIFKTPSRKFEFYSGNLENLLKRTGQGVASRLVYLPHYEEVKFLGDELSYPLVLSTYQPLLNIENGNQNYPWAQEFFLVMHGSGWTNFVEMNSQTARSLGIRDGEMVWVESLFNRIKVRARVTEGIHPQVVAIAVGQGHYAAGRWQQAIGVNPNEIIGVDYDRFSGQSSFFNTRVKVYRA